MALATRLMDGIQVPKFLYGTAWKEDQTQRLVELAIDAGFRGIDTANQRRHYDEQAVGRGIASAMARGEVTRDDLFLQTKFTFRRGQDHRLPYDPNAPVATQVQQSAASSLAHLGVATLDCYLLHGPSQNVGLVAPDWEAWQAMEELQQSGRVRLLGVSNVSIEQLQELCQRARIRPAFVQNRCFAELGWDYDVRKFCANCGIAYQGFSLLTANRSALMHPEMQRIAQRYGRPVTQIAFRFAIDVGMVPLTGTSDPAHMRSDLAVGDFRLDPREVEQIEQLVSR